MLKHKKLKYSKQKSCYGTKEYSERSFICQKCEYIKQCGAIKYKQPRPNKNKNGRTNVR